MLYFLRLVKYDSPSADYTFLTLSSSGMGIPFMWWTSRNTLASSRMNSTPQMIITHHRLQILKLKLCICGGHWIKFDEALFLSQPISLGYWRLESSSQGYVGDIIQEVAYLAKLLFYSEQCCTQGNVLIRITWDSVWFGAIFLLQVIFYLMLYLGHFYVGQAMFYCLQYFTWGNTFTCGESCFTPGQGILWAMFCIVLCLTLRMLGVDY